MRLGVAFWSGVNPDNIDSTLQRLARIGVKGIGHIVAHDWHPEQLQQCRDAVEAQGCFIGEVTLYHCGWPLASSDPNIRREASESLSQGLCAARALKAHCVGVSVIANGPEEGDLWCDEVWSRLVQGMAQVMIEAENLGVDLGIHPGNRGPLDAPAQLRRLLDDVASPRLKVILDPVNMTTHRTYYNTTAFLDYTFDLLGPDIIAAHAKDVSLDTSHWVTKLDEVPLGMGQLDYETYLRRLGELDADVLLTIEHYRDVGVSGTVASPVYVNYPDTDWENTRARNYIHELAQKVGVEVH